MIRGVFSNEPAEQIPAARQGEADRDPSVDVLQFFCLEIPSNGPSVKRIRCTGGESMNGRTQLARAMPSAMAIAA
jgi:hypothetical protein